MSVIPASPDSHRVGSRGERHITVRINILTLDLGPDSATRQLHPVHFPILKRIIRIHS